MRTFKTVRLLMKPQLNSREAPTLTQVTGIVVRCFFFSFSSSIHLNSRKYRSFHVHLNHGLSICESVQQKVTQVGSISPTRAGQMSLIFSFLTFKLL